MKQSYIYNCFITFALFALIFTIWRYESYISKMEDTNHHNLQTISSYEDLVRDFNEVIALQDIRIDQLKTQLKYCQEQDFYGVTL